MRRAILSALFVYSTCVGAAEQPVVLENGRSPDGKYFMRIQPPGDLGAVMYLEVCTIAEATVVGKTNAGGYAHFSMMADEMNTTVLWSPDSTHFALMTRGTKRSTEVRLFQMTSTGMAEITLPSPTDRAMVLLKAAESNRCVFQRPLKWLDKRTLTVRASGDVVNPDGSKVPLWYEVDVTYDIEEKKIAAVKLIEVKPNEG